MAQFIAAVHSSDASPRAMALVETSDTPQGAHYTVREVREIGEWDALNSFLASEPQYVGQTSVVTTGGQNAADALHAHGPSAAAVTLRAGNSADRDALDVSVQVLVDTFEMLFRAGSIDVPITSEAASDAARALYHGADVDNAAPEGDRDTEGDLEASTDSPEPDVIEQSGSAAATSTEVIKSPITVREATVAAVEAAERAGRIAADTGAEAPSLGDHEATALALALAVWYGEATADDLPLTDQADEVNSKRARRNAARS